MDSLLARSRALEPRLRVWVTLDEDAALDAARRSQEALERSGPMGPLHGVPFAVKDIFYTEGVRTTAGSPIYAEFVPAHDSTAVARLKAQGAVMMGKTVTTEFAAYDPPPTRNPWDPAHTPGGSSSGSAAGVAARMFPAALGSQTGGSVLRPAAYNGVIGFKPTFGRISRYGVFPVSHSLDTMGFFVRSVEDAALLLGPMAGRDPSDPSSSARPAPDYRGALAHAAPPRIGLLRQFFVERSDAEVLGNMRRTEQLLAAAGADVVEVEATVDFDGLLAAHRVVMSVEMAAVQGPDFSERPDDYAPKIRGDIEAGRLMSAVGYVQAQDERRGFRAHMDGALRGLDVLLVPSTPTAAPADLTTTGDPAFQSPWTSCGFPTISLPSGLTESGMPLGVQLVAGAFEEEALLAAASWCEGVLDVDLMPPLDR
jgi:Asp-tRNA(Asn)/Glu-tRNA(Gln) amidotransferase A subunit family amidase